MKAYIHGVGRADASDVDFKSIVRDALMRRRMSRIVRQGVTAGWVAQEGHPVDAILTATGMGCLTDSEKFLRNVIDTDEQLLSPTSFIQSTFNTIGATIALLQGNHAYNMTYTHGGDSFLSAVLDGVMLLEEGQHHEILVGAVEEFTPTLKTLLGRMRVGEIEGDGGAYFFRLSSVEEGALAVVEISETKTEEDLTRRYENPLLMAAQVVDALDEKRSWVACRNHLRVEVKCL